MLFNSFEFIFVFMPVVVAGFLFLVRRETGTVAIFWLIAASYVFYGWLKFELVLLLAGSTAFNFAVGRFILSARADGRHFAARIAMWIGVAGDLGLLGYFKYTGFFLGLLGGIENGPTLIVTSALPIGISFFTFTQIAFLVDATRGRVKSVPFGEYFLFVSYFPHLVAGPIIHHEKTIPQFLSASRHHPGAEWIAAGLSIFALGLAKKTLIADHLAPFADRLYDSAGSAPVTAVAGWIGTLAYTFQIYFDFSAYSDMAIGLSLMLGVRLPINFNSPYKATSFIDFWTRWHISLSQFLRDYLYIPLGGNRRGEARRYVNLMATMLLGGLWHGAGWTFVVWGGLHGVYLALNHFVRRAFGPPSASGAVVRAAKSLVVFAAVAVAWVFFRAETMDAARAVLAGMAGFNGVGALPDAGAGSWLAAAFVIAWAMPNTIEIFSDFQIALANARSPVAAPPGWLSWRPSAHWVAATSLVLAAGIMGITEFSPFLYFQF